VSPGFISPSFEQDKERNAMLNKEMKIFIVSELKI